MGFLKKKKIEETPEPECKHKYRDFPWYLTAVQNHSGCTISIIEPYVCVWCGNRRDVVLHELFKDSSMYKNLTKEATSTIKYFEEIYKDQLQPRAVVEDQINDMKLVDRDYLRALALINPNALVGMDENAKIALKKS